VNIADGLGPILAFMDSLPAENTKVDVRRCFEDGDYSVAHAEYVLGDSGALIGFEVHRWEDNRIVEHWDNLQSAPPSANPSGRTMTDGADAVSDIPRSVENKALVEDFVERVLIGGDDAALTTFFNGDELIQHSPYYGDGLSAFREQLRRWRLEGRVTYGRVQKVLGEGNMVLVISEGTFGDEPGAFYDLYRVSNGKLAEHWDVIETIPPREKWQNDNGKF